jgi:hypothetical protein
VKLPGIEPGSHTGRLHVFRVVETIQPHLKYKLTLWLSRKKS